MEFERPGDARENLRLVTGDVTGRDEELESMRKLKELKVYRIIVLVPGMRIRVGSKKTIRNQEPSNLN